MMHWCNRDRLLEIISWNGMNMKRRRVVELLVGIALLAVVQGAGSEEVINVETPQWLPLAQDNLHDPTGPGLQMLQEPAEALSQLPGDVVGNRVNWVRALDASYIDPRTNLHSSKKEKVLELDVIRTRTGEMNMVLFPHRPHTDWLDCTNCHEWLFKSKAGATRFTMYDILKGEFCGRCHGAVAFPLTQCNRCHSVPRTVNTIPGSPN